MEREKSVLALREAEYMLVSLLPGWPSIAMPVIYTQPPPSQVHTSHCTFHPVTRPALTACTQTRGFPHPSNQAIPDSPT